MSTRLPALEDEDSTISIQPGERRKEDSKFILVIDSSYSMSKIIQTVFTEFSALIKHYDLNSSCLLYRFNSIYDVFLVNTRTKEAYELTHRGAKKSRVSLHKILGSYGGGTFFSTELCKELEKKISLGYNLIIASDSDILWEDNKENLMRLIRKGKNSVFVILDCQSTYSSMLKYTNVKPTNVSFWNEK
jgi:spore maturation protein CgeB